MKEGTKQIRSIWENKNKKEKKKKWRWWGSGHFRIESSFSLKFRQSINNQNNNKNNKKNPSVGQSVEISLSIDRFFFLTPFVVSTHSKKNYLQN